MLQFYPDPATARELVHGFQFGFSLHFTGIRSSIIAKNMLSATSHSAQLHQKIFQEVQLGRIAGPFSNIPISNLRCSPIGVVPKKQGGWRMICNLSAPQGQSVNDFIDPDQCSVQYTSFDNTTTMISKLGRSALLGKKDIANAFRLLPIRPEDFPLLGFHFNNKYYIDKCLPFGCSIACATFVKFSSAMHWIIEHTAKASSMVHYLDDFLFAGSATSNTCLHLMNSFDQVCHELGVPISHEKTEGPATSITFLGLGIDTVSQTIYVPQDKVQALRDLLSDTISRDKVTLKHMQSLAGSLAFITKAIPAGRAFCRRLYSSLSQASKPYHLVRVSKTLRQDMEVWLEFLSKYNNVTPMSDPYWLDHDTLLIASDSSGSMGCGVIFGSQWAHLQWPKQWSAEIRRDITFLELIPVALAIYVWGQSLQSKKIILNIDNEAVVHILNQKTSKSDRVMSLLRPMLIRVMQNNIQIKSVHVPGCTNLIPDALSRFQWQTFRQLAPHADQYPCAIPPEFWNILNPE